MICGRLLCFSYAFILQLRCKKCNNLIIKKQKGDELMSSETLEVIETLIVEIAKAPETKTSSEMVTAISELVAAINQY